MITLRRAAACGLMAVATACPAFADTLAGNPPTLGPVFQVTGSDAKCQHAPLAAALPGSGFAVAWSQGYPPAAFLRFGNGEGRLPAPEIRIAGRQVEALGTDAAGTVRVIWRSQTPAPALSLQSFSPAGQALGAEVALPIPPPPGKLAAAFAADGRFAVVWQAGGRVAGRWFSAAGMPLGAEFEIEPAAGSSAPWQATAAAAIDSSGHLAAAWSALPGPASQVIRFRRFDVQGTALGPAVDASRDAVGSGFDSSPAIAATGDGGLTLAWIHTETIPLASGLRYRSFNAAGQPKGPAGAVGATNDDLPLLASDGAHRVALAWQHNDGTAWMAMLPAVPGAEPPAATALNPELEPGSGLVQTAALAFLTGGRLAAFWDDYAPPFVLPSGCDYLGIFGRLVDPDPDFRPAQTGPERGLSDFTGEAGLAPALATTKDGGFVAVWQTGDPGLVVSRAFDPDGNPRGPETVIDPSSTRLRDIAVTTLADGTLVAAWAPFNSPSLSVTLRHLDAAGQPLGLARNAGPPGARMPVVAARGEGFLLGWSAGPPLALTVQPFHADGTTAGAPVQIGGVANGSFYALEAVPGGFLVSWNTVATELLAQRLTDLGAPAGAAFTVWSDPSQPQVLPQLAALPGGGVAIAWSAFLAPFHFAAGARVRRFGQDGRPWEDPVDVETLDALTASDENQSLYVHAIGTSRDGTLWLLLGTDSASRETHLSVLAVRDGVPTGPPVPVGSSATNGGAGGLFRFGSLAAGDCGWLAGWSAAVSGGGYRSFVQRATGGCLAGPPTLRLGAGGRFRAQITWRTPPGATGSGNPRRLADDSGAFWFFAPNNPELMLKALDGRGVNGAFWVFYATLTDVAFDLTVTDSATGRSKTYSKPQGRLESRADVNAFPAAGAGSVPAAMALDPREEPLSPSPCPAGASGLCLAGRFNAGIHFTDPRDHSGHDAVPIPLTADAGSFWFFGPDNLEMLVKIVDGRPVNQKWWFFYGALSTVDYDITVTDTQTGARQIYRNRHGALTSTADTEAFP